MFPVFISSILGFIYGCTFLLQHKKTLFAKTHNTRAHGIAFFIIRIGILFGVGNYLLRTPLIPSIISIISFFAVFWVIIFQAKAKVYEQI